MGTLVVRAWAESGSGGDQVRARVLAISGPDAQMQELGVAAGIDSILELIADGLEQVLSTGDLPDLS
jgi:hypothetical protein